MCVCVCVYINKYCLNVESTEVSNYKFIAFVFL